MKLLKEINDGKITTSFKTREASKAVLFDDNSMIPMLFISKYNYHKLPGGGIKSNESTEDGLTREIKEETGCKIKITGKVGKIIEFRSKLNLKQTSYCYTGKILSKDRPEFTKKEIEDGSKLLWMSIDDAIYKVKNDKPTNYEGPFIQKRDLVFLKKAKSMVKASKTAK